jgi:signal peptidase II
VRKHHSRAVSLSVFAVVACMVVVLDRVTKSLAESALSGGRTQDFIPGFLDFQLVYNTGAAWGMLDGARTFFIIIAAFCVVGAVLYLAFTRNSVLTILGFGMIAGGAIGNGIDRALSGRVTDFIHTLFIEFPLFNIADSAITVGFILFLIAVFFVELRKPRKAESAPTLAEGVSEGMGGERSECDGGGERTNGGRDVRNGDNEGRE